MREPEPWRFWGYAAAFGALWGAVEVTVGSFLHAIRIPFSGVVLAGVGAAVLVALRIQLPNRGVVLAAGLVCAGIKLLSPTGAVVGPMVAILTESLIVEVALLTGVRAPSAALSGSLCALWSTAQKLITQTIFFGAPILSIYQGILRQAEKSLRLPAADGAWAASLFLGIVTLLGAGVGIIGLLIGRAAQRQRAEALS